MLGSGIYAAATILFVMIAKRCAGEEAGAQFYMAFTTGQMLLTLGYFEMRPFQSTDVSYEYTAGEYFGFRGITCGLMVLGSVFVAAVYAVFRNTDAAGVLLIIVVSCYKMFDGVSDVFEGEFQRRDRMDLAGKSMFVRVLLAMIAFTLVCVFSKSVLAASGAILVVALVSVFLADIPWMEKMEHVRISFEWRRMKALCARMILLFLGSMMCVWIWNGTKYVVEWMTDAESTLAYGIVFMPTMVINLGSGFLFKPMLTTMARQYEEGRCRKFAGTVGILSVGVVLITIAALICGGMLGIPVLSFVYDMNLAPYKRELMILLVGGGFNALGIIFYYALTVMRKMGYIFTGYIVTLLASIALPVYMTGQWGVFGAAVSYCVLMILLTAVFAIMTFTQLAAAGRKLSAMK